MPLLVFFQDQVPEIEHLFRAFAATFFTICLKRVGYFGNHRVLSEDFNEDEIFVGNLKEASIEKLIKKSYLEHSINHITSIILTGLNISLRTK